MGCHQNENKLFYTQKANGILGIGGSDTLLKVLFRDKTHVTADVFSMCLSEWGGHLTVGGYNSKYHRGDIAWIPLDPDEYVVDVTAMQVAGGSPFASFRDTKVDSGTTYTFMGSAQYKTLRSSIETYCQQHNGCGASLSGKCWTVPGLYDGLKLFPTVEVYFGSVLTNWEPRSYLVRWGESSRFCYAFEDDGHDASTVLGASWMLYHDVIFDVTGRRLGIASADCPQYRSRPLAPQAGGEALNLNATLAQFSLPATLEASPKTSLSSSLVASSRSLSYSVHTIAVASLFFLLASMILYSANSRLKPVETNDRAPLTASTGAEVDGTFQGSDEESQPMHASL